MFSELAGPDNAVRASSLSALAFSPVPRIDFSPSLEDTKSVVETSDIALRGRRVLHGKVREVPKNCTLG